MSDAGPAGSSPRLRDGGGAAALASSLVPGWGQILNGQDQAGRALLFVDGGLVIAGLAAAFFLQVELLKAWVTPAAIVGILGLNIALLAYRGAATAWAFANGSPKTGFDWSALIVAAGIVVVPHLLIGSLALTQYDLLNAVFQPSEPVTAAPPPTTSTSTTSGHSSSTSSAPEPTTTPSPATTTTSLPRIWDGKDRLNIMLLGSDAGVGRIGTRTDTIILVSIEPESGNVAMFSVPRNLTFAPLPDGMGVWSCNCFPDIITHLWANAEWYPDAFPGPQEPSVNALKGALGLIFDLDIHYYAKADLKGFVGVVDALGGVTIDVPERISDPIYPHEDGGTEDIVFEPGVQHLDGHRALAYARIRRNSGDFARMHRQRCVLGALVAQTGPGDVIGGFGRLATAVKENVVTDIPIDRLPDLVEILPKVDTSKVATLRITRYNYGVGGNNPGQQRYDLERIKDDARTLLNDPATALETLDGVGFEDTCEESFD